MRRRGRMDLGGKFRIFICYKRNAHPDTALAGKVFKKLQSRGHDAFMDRIISVGSVWEDELERRITEADFFVVLLSSTALKSSIIRTEIEIARETLEEHGKPQLLQIRIAFDERLPLSLRFLDRRHYCAWESEHDTERVIDEIVDIIESKESVSEDPISELKPEPPAGAKATGSPGREMSASPRPPHPVSPAASEARKACAPYAGEVEALPEGAFLVLYLDWLYGSLIDLTFSAAEELDGEGMAALAKIRSEAVQISEYLRRTHKEPAIEKMFDGLREHVDGWHGRCKEIAEIERLTQQQISAVQDQPPPRTDSTLEILGHAATVTMSIDQLRRVGAQRKSEAHHRYVNSYNAGWQELRGSAMELAIERNWPHAGCAFDASPQNRSQMKIWREKDPEKYREVIGRQAAQRSVDPFLFSMLGKALLARPDVTYAEMAALAPKVAAAVMLVPSSHIYDDRRGEMLFFASNFLSNLVMKHQAGKMSGSSSIDMAQQALPVLEALETHYSLLPDPDEVTIQNRLSLLGAANRIREAFDYAMRHKDRVWKSSGACYNTACYGCLLGHLDTAWAYLQHAFRELGYTSVKYAATDPDLESLRRSKKQEWDTFFSCKVRASIVHGAFNDDITFENLSSFPLSNVRLTCYTHFVNGKYNSLELTVSYIPPGRMQEWSNVVNVPGKSFTTSPLRCYLVSDQSEGWINEALKAAGQS